MKRVVSLILATIFVILLATGCAKSEKTLTAVELLDLGEKYLLELNYEQAVVQFLKVIEVEPMNPRSYTGAAEAYVGLGDTANAEAVLHQGLEVLPGNKEIEEMLTTFLIEPNTATEPNPISDENLSEESKYAKIFYQYIQDELIPTGRFIDADMVYWDNKPTMITSEYSNQGEIIVLRYELEENGYINSSGYGTGFSSESIDGRGYEAVIYFLGEYDGKTAIMSYSHLVETWNYDWDTEIRTDYSLMYHSFGDVDFGHITVFIEISSDGSVAREGGGIFTNDDIMAHYSFEEGRTLIESYLSPLSTWGIALVGDAPFLIENTDGERLKDYY